MEREKKIDAISKLINLKRIEYVKYYTLYVIKHLFISITLAVILVTLKWTSINYGLDIFSYDLIRWLLNICIAIVIRNLVVSFRGGYHICKVKILKIKVLDIEQHLSKLSDIDLSILKSELKQLHWCAQIICLQETIILRDGYRFYCIPYASLESIELTNKKGNINFVRCVYQKNEYAENTETVIHVNKEYHLEKIPDGVDAEKIMNENKTFYKLVKIPKV